MHPTNIKQEAGYLGPHPCIVEPGQVHYLVLQDADDGPFWMTLDEMEAKRHSQLDEPSNVATTKDNLLRDHKKADISMNRLKGKRVSNIQDLVTLKYVATVNRVRKESVKV